MDHDSLRAAYEAGVPFAGTIGTEYVELGADKVILRLPDDRTLHNHLGGPHAGAMFTLAESASGIIIIANFAEHIATITPLPGSAEIFYRKVAKGPVTATATMPRPRDDVLAEVADEGKARLDIPVSIATEDGTETGEVVVRWHLRRTG